MMKIPLKRYKYSSDETPVWKEFNWYQKGEDMLTTEKPAMSIFDANVPTNIDILQNDNGEKLEVIPQTNLGQLALKYYNASDHPISGITEEPEIWKQFHWPNSVMNEMPKKFSSNEGSRGRLISGTTEEHEIWKQFNWPHSEEEIGGLPKENKLDESFEELLKTTTKPLSEQYNWQNSDQTDDKFIILPELNNEQVNETIQKSILRTVTYDSPFTTQGILNNSEFAVNGNFISKNRLTLTKEQTRNKSIEFNEKKTNNYTLSRPRTQNQTSNAEIPIPVSAAEPENIFITTEVFKYFPKVDEDNKNWKKSTKARKKYTQILTEKIGTEGAPIQSASSSSLTTENNKFGMSHPNKLQTPKSTFNRKPISANEFIELFVTTQIFHLLDLNGKNKNSSEALSLGETNNTPSIITEISDRVPLSSDIPKETAENSTATTEAIQSSKKITREENEKTATSKFTILTTDTNSQETEVIEKTSESTVTGVESNFTSIPENTLTSLTLEKVLRISSRNGPFLTEGTHSSTKIESEENEPTITYSELEISATRTSGETEKIDETSSLRYEGLTSTIHVEHMEISTSANRLAAQLQNEFASTVVTENPIENESGQFYTPEFTISTQTVTSEETEARDESAQSPIPDVETNFSSITKESAISSTLKSELEISPGNIASEFGTSVTIPGGETEKTKKSGYITYEGHISITHGEFMEISTSPNSLATKVQTEFTGTDETESSIEISSEESEQLDTSEFAISTQTVSSEETDAREESAQSPISSVETHFSSITEESVISSTLKSELEISSGNEPTLTTQGSLETESEETEPTTASESEITAAIPGVENEKTKNSDHITYEGPISITHGELMEISTSPNRRATKVQAGFTTIEETESSIEINSEESEQLRTSEFAVPTETVTSEETEEREESAPSLISVVETNFSSITEESSVSSDALTNELKFSSGNKPTLTAQVSLETESGETESTTASELEISASIPGGETEETKRSGSISITYEGPMSISHDERMEISTLANKLATKVHTELTDTEETESSIEINSEESKQLHTSDFAISTQTVTSEETEAREESAQSPISGVETPFSSITEESSVSSAALTNELKFSSGNEPTLTTQGSLKTDSGGTESTTASEFEISAAIPGGETEETKRSGSISITYEGPMSIAHGERIEISTSANRLVTKVHTEFTDTEETERSIEMISEETNAREESAQSPISHAENDVSSITEETTLSSTLTNELKISSENEPGLTVQVSSETESEESEQSMTSGGETEETQKSDPITYEGTPSSTYLERVKLSSSANRLATKVHAELTSTKETESGELHTSEFTGSAKILTSEEIEPKEESAQTAISQFMGHHFTNNKKTALSSSLTDELRISSGDRATPTQETQSSIEIDSEEYEQTSISVFETNVLGSSATTLASEETEETKETAQSEIDKEESEQKPQELQMSSAEIYKGFHTTIHGTSENEPKATIATEALTTAETESSIETSEDNEGILTAQFSNSVTTLRSQKTVATEGMAESSIARLETGHSIIHEGLGINSQNRESITEATQSSTETEIEESEQTNASEFEINIITTPEGEANKSQESNSATYDSHYSTSSGEKVSLSTLAKNLTSQTENVDNFNEESKNSTETKYTLNSSLDVSRRINNKKIEETNHTTKVDSPAIESKTEEENQETTSTEEWEKIEATTTNETEDSFTKVSSVVKKTEEKSKFTTSPIRDRSTIQEIHEKLSSTLASDLRENSEEKLPAVEETQNSENHKEETEQTTTNATELEISITIPGKEIKEHSKSIETYFTSEPESQTREENKETTEAEWQDSLPENTAPQSVQAPESTISEIVDRESTTFEENKKSTSTPRNELKTNSEGAAITEETQSSIEEQTEQTETHEKEKVNEETERKTSKSKVPVNGIPSTSGEVYEADVKKEPTSEPYDFEIFSTVDREETEEKHNSSIKNSTSTYHKVNETPSALVTNYITVSEGTAVSESMNIEERVQSSRSENQTFGSTAGEIEDSGETSTEEWQNSDFVSPEKAEHTVISKVEGFSKSNNTQETSKSTIFKFETNYVTIPSTFKSKLRTSTEEEVTVNIETQSPAEVSKHRTKTASEYMNAETTEHFGSTVGQDAEKLSKSKVFQNSELGSLTKEDFTTEEWQISELTSDEVTKRTVITGEEGFYTTTSISVGKNSHAKDTEKTFSSTVEIFTSKRENAETSQYSNHYTTTRGGNDLPLITEKELTISERSDVAATKETLGFETLLFSELVVTKLSESVGAESLKMSQTLDKESLSTEKLEDDKELEGAQTTENESITKVLEETDVKENERTIPIGAKTSIGQEIEEKSTSSARHGDQLSTLQEVYEENESTFNEISTLTVMEEKQILESASSEKSGDIPISRFDVHYENEVTSHKEVPTSSSTNTIENEQKLSKSENPATKSGGKYAEFTGSTTFKYKDGYANTNVENEINTNPKKNPESTREKEISSSEQIESFSVPRDESEEISTSATSRYIVNHSKSHEVTSSEDAQTYVSSTNSVKGNIQRTTSKVNKEATSSDILISSETSSKKAEGQSIISLTTETKETRTQTSSSSEEVENDESKSTLIFENENFSKLTNSGTLFGTNIKSESLEASPAFTTVEIIDIGNRSSKISLKNQNQEERIHEKLIAYTSSSKYYTRHFNISTPTNPGRLLNTEPHFLLSNYVSESSVKTSTASFSNSEAFNSTREESEKEYKNSAKQLHSHEIQTEKNDDVTSNSSKIMRKYNENYNYEHSTSIIDTNTNASAILTHTNAHKSFANGSPNIFWSTAKEQYKHNKHNEDDEDYVEDKVTSETNNKGKITAKNIQKLSTNEPGSVNKIPQEITAVHHIDNFFLPNKEQSEKLYEHTSTNSVTQTLKKFKQKLRNSTAFAGSFDINNTENQNSKTHTTSMIDNFPKHTTKSLNSTTNFLGSRETDDEEEYEETETESDTPKLENEQGEVATTGAFLITYTDTQKEHHVLEVIVSPKATESIQREETETSLDQKTTPEYDEKLKSITEKEMHRRVTKHSSIRPEELSPSIKFITPSNHKGSATTESRDEDDEVLSTTPVYETQIAAKFSESTIARGPITSAITSNKASFEASSSHFTTTTSDNQNSQLTTQHHQTSKSKNSEVVISTEHLTRRLLDIHEAFNERDMAGFSSNSDSTLECQGCTDKHGNHMLRHENYDENEEVVSKSPSQHHKGELADKEVLTNFFSNYLETTSRYSSRHEENKKSQQVTLKNEKHPERESEIQHVIVVGDEELEKNHHKTITNKSHSINEPHPCTEGEKLADLELSIQKEIGRLKKLEHELEYQIEEERKSVNNENHQARPSTEEHHGDDTDEAHSEQYEKLSTEETHGEHEEHLPNEKVQEEGDKTHQYTGKTNNEHQEGHHFTEKYHEVSHENHIHTENEDDEDLETQHRTAANEEEHSLHVIETIHHNQHESLHTDEAHHAANEEHPPTEEAHVEGHEQHVTKETGTEKHEDHYHTEIAQHEETKEHNATEETQEEYHKKTSPEKAHEGHDGFSSNKGIHEEEHIEHHRTEEFHNEEQEEYHSTEEQHEELPTVEAHGKEHEEYQPNKTVPQEKYQKDEKDHSTEESQNEDHDDHPPTEQTHQETHVNYTHTENEDDEDQETQHHTATNEKELDNHVIKDIDHHQHESPHVGEHLSTEEAHESLENHLPEESPTEHHDDNLNTGRSQNKEQIEHHPHEQEYETHRPREGSNEQMLHTEESHEEGHTYNHHTPQIPNEEQKQHHSTEKFNEEEYQPTEEIQEKKHEDLHQTVETQNEEQIERHPTEESHGEYHEDHLSTEEAHEQEEEKHLTEESHEGKHEKYPTEGPYEEEHEKHSTEKSNEDEHKYYHHTEEILNKEQNQHHPTEESDKEEYEKQHPTEQAQEKKHEDHHQTVETQNEERIEEHPTEEFHGEYHENHRSTEEAHEQEEEKHLTEESHEGKHEKYPTEGPYEEEHEKHSTEKSNEDEHKYYHHTEEILNKGQNQHHPTEESDKEEYEKQHPTEQAQEEEHEDHHHTVETQNGEYTEKLKPPTEESHTKKHGKHPTEEDHHATHKDHEEEHESYVTEKYHQQKQEDYLRTMTSQNEEQIEHLPTEEYHEERQENHHLTEESHEEGREENLTEKGREEEHENDHTEESHEEKQENHLTEKSHHVTNEDHHHIEDFHEEGYESHVTEKSHQKEHEDGHRTIESQNGKQEVHHPTEESNENEKNHASEEDHENEHEEHHHTVQAQNEEQKEPHTEEEYERQHPTEESPENVHEKYHYTDTSNREKEEHRITDESILEKHEKHHLIEEAHHKDDEMHPTQESYEEKHHPTEEIHEEDQENHFRESSYTKSNEEKHHPNEKAHDGKQEKQYAAQEFLEKEQEKYHPSHSSPNPILDHRPTEESNQEDHEEHRGTEENAEDLRVNLETQEIHRVTETKEQFVTESYASHEGHQVIMSNHGAELSEHYFITITAGPNNEQELIEVTVVPSEHTAITDHKATLSESSTSHTIDNFKNKHAPIYIELPVISSDPTHSLEEFINYYRRLFSENAPSQTVSRSGKDFVIILSGIDFDDLMKMNGSKWIPANGAHLTPKEQNKSSEIQTKIKQTSCSCNLSQSTEKSFDVSLSQDTILIPMPKNVVRTKCLDGDYCLCSIDDMVNNLKIHLRNKEYKLLSIEHCNSYLKVEEGLMINNDSLAEVRKKRSHFFLKLTEKTKEIIGLYKINGFFQEDDNLQNTDRKLYALSGNKVTIPCVYSSVIEESSKMKYSWSMEDNKPVTVGKIRDNDGSLTLHDVTPQDDSNYTCFVKTHSDDAQERAKFLHELSVVSLPIYKLKNTIYYYVDDGCSLENCDLLYNYMPKIIDGLLCGYYSKICRLEVYRPTCFKTKKVNHVNLTYMAILNPLEALAPVDPVECNIKCQLRIYSSLSKLILFNMEALEKIPVISTLQSSKKHFKPQMLDIINNSTNDHHERDHNHDHYDDRDHEKNHNSSILGEVIFPQDNDARLLIVCPGGFGLKSSHRKICFACPVNTYSSDDQSYCNPCPNGQYQNLRGSKTCVVCNSPLEDKRCLQVLYSNTKYFALYVGIAFTMVIFVLLAIYFFTKMDNDEFIYRPYPNEAPLAYNKRMANMNKDVEADRVPLLADDNSPPSVPPLDF